VLDELADPERLLWGVVVATMLADIYLTQLGLQHGLREGNPVVRGLIETAGIAALAALKLGVVGLGGAVRALVPDRHAIAVPAGLALPWLGAVLVNGTLLFGS